MIQLDYLSSQALEVLLNYAMLQYFLFDFGSNIVYRDQSNTEVNQYFLFDSHSNRDDELSLNILKINNHIII